MKPVRVRPHIRRIPAMPGINIQEGKIDYLRRRPGNPQVQELAQGYNAAHGLPPVEDIDAKAQPEVQRKIAKAYEALPMFDPAAAPAYDAFAREIEQQYEWLVSAGIAFDFSGTDPYPTSTAMMDDVRQNRRLRVFTGGEPHPYLSAKTNNKFRGVHDLLGHAAWGNEFGPSGEMSAYFDHSQMFSPLAQKAMATETLGQNSVFNFSARNEGKPVSQREFAPQKAALLPDELIL